MKPSGLPGRLLHLLSSYLLLLLLNNQGIVMATKPGSKAFIGKPAPDFDGKLVAAVAT